MSPLNGRWSRSTLMSRSGKHTKPQPSVAVATVLGLVLIVVWLGFLKSGVPAHAEGEKQIPAYVNAAKPPAEKVADVARTFISDTCVRCHNGVKKTAGLDLTSLSYEPDDRGNFALWVKIHDRVAAGDMPPPDED